MLKMLESVNALGPKAAAALRSLLEQVPAIELGDISLESDVPGREVDLLAHVRVGGRRHALACEINTSGQPRHVRMALLQLRDHIAHLGHAATPILIAPYLSPEARTLCREQGAGFLDLEGNARLVFDGVFIDRQVSTKPPPDRRELKSLFKPKSAQVLRVLLRDPGRRWRVAELAATADVSLGHVSNVRAGLLDREWARVSDDGLFLAEPDALLDTWRDDYEPPVGKRLGFYTPLHGSAFEADARAGLAVEHGNGNAAFASFSAANWLAPYGRTGTHYFYAEAAAVERLQAALKLTSASKGENVVIDVPKDPGLFRDCVEPAPGALCTSAVQTYLDLAIAGERGREAADHLRRERLAWRE
jgi:hypothetical protein